MKLVKSYFGGDVVVLAPNIFNDHRGRFVKTYNSIVFADIGLPTNWVEEFYSTSRKGVIRGMHYQSPPAHHHKMVYCLSGRVLDVILDIRAESSTFGSHICFEISGEDSQIIIIPPGFAHGFCTLSDEALMQYKVSTTHSPEHDTGVLWNSFGCSWPYERPIISERDTKFPALGEVATPFSTDDF